ncbi:hypothetical protein SHAb15599_00043 [Acinetobacter phage SH-Ab 15599]|nr:hypothetical protein SHAb15599_00043 [Acinetobacter phage SH-Ab 15599]
MNKDEAEKEMNTTEVAKGTDLNDIKGGGWYKWNGKPKSVKDYTTGYRRTVMIVVGKKKEH